MSSDSQRVARIPQDAPTVRDALLSDPLLQELILEGPLHEESLTLTRSLKIRAAEQCKVTLKGQQLIQGGEVSFLGLTLRGEGPSPTLTLTEGALKLTDSVVESSDGPFIEATGPNAKLTVERATMLHGEGVGLLVTDGAELRASEMSCGHTGDDVIVLKRGASAYLEGCVTYPAAQCGLWVHQGSRAVVRGCEFFQHPNNHIQATEGSEVTVTDSVFQQGGVSVCDGSSFTGERLKLSYATQAVLLLQSEGELTLKDCHIQGGEFGLFIEGDAKQASLEGCLIQGAQYAAISVDSRLTTSRCSFVDSPLMISTSSPELIRMNQTLGLSCSRLYDYLKKRTARLASTEAIYLDVEPSSRRRKRGRDLLLTSAIKHGHLLLFKELVSLYPKPRSVHFLYEEVMRLTDPALRVHFERAIDQMKPKRATLKRSAPLTALGQQLTSVYGARQVARQLRSPEAHKTLTELIRGSHLDAGGVIKAGPTLEALCNEPHIQAALLLELSVTLTQYELGDPSLHLSQIISLNLEGHHLRAIPPPVLKMKQLRSLHLKDNYIFELPSTICELADLQILNLRSNLLTALPRELGQLAQLIKLDLSSNQLTHLPAELSGLSSLKTLELSNNQLTALPEELCCLNTLHQLWLEGNQLTELPQGVHALRELLSLKLYSNPLSSFPDELLSLPKLSELDLRATGVTTWPKQSELPPQLKLLGRAQS